MDHVFSTENRGYVSSRLRTRLILYFFISIVLLVLIAYDVVVGDTSWLVAFGALLFGGVIGFIYGRFARVRWHETEEKIVMRYDALAIILIVAYVLFSYLRDWFLGRLLGGAALEAVTFAVLAGLLFGRVLGLHIAIMRVLRKRKSLT